MTEPVVVVDTDIHVSSERYAKKADSPTREIIARGYAGHFIWALSPQLMDEINRKLLEHGVPPNMVAAHLGRLASIARHFEDILAPAELVCSDPNDLFVMVLARTSAAWCIVADDHSLVTDTGTPPGWKPPRFLARLREQRGEPLNQRFLPEQR